MQTGPLPSRGESPTSHHQNLPLYSMHGDQFIHTPQQSLYNNPNANNSTDFSPFPDNEPQSSNPYDTGPYRSNSVVGPFFSTRQRQTVAGPSSAMGNDLNGNGFQYNLSQADVFGTHQSLPSIHQAPQSLNGMRGYDFANDVQTIKQNGKPIFTNMDPFGSAAMSHQLNKIQTQQQLHNLQTQFNSMNGILQSQSQAHSQTPFGPHVNSNGSGLGTAHSNGVGTVSVMNQQEEISTIFVVGFPDDMQEREFQNMFTFSPGFEAATLKIPNKDSTAYGSNVPSTANNMNTAGRGAFQLGGYSYSGANDPYNLVTVNQGGVVVDGRDGTTSWPSADTNEMQSGYGGGNQQNPGQGQGPVPPRKQIIGFAKFRSRAEALAARDLLQGRRVDIEKGAVLKAEMAKKNLHTKRGVGPVGVQPLVSGSGPGAIIGGLSGMGNAMNSVSGGMSSVTDGLSGLNGLLSPGTGPGETISARDRELGALTAMGLGNVRRDRIDQEEDRERRRRELGSISSVSGIGSLSALGTRGPRERVEEDERERRRREKEVSRLRAGSQATYDAFHSVALGPIRNTSMANTVLSPSDSLGGYPFPTSQGFSPQEALGGSGMDNWPTPSNRRPTGLSLNGGLRSLPIGIPTSAGNASSHQSSPSDVNTDPAFPASFSSQSGASEQLEQDNFNATKSVSISSHASVSSVGSRSRPYSPSNEATLSSSGFLPPLPEQQQQQPSNQTQGHGCSNPLSSSSSISGSRSSTGSVDEDVARVMGSLDLGSQQGTISPQLPSPHSGASSGSGVKTNASDQNPPINTLYVGNLPTSPIPSNQPNLLEESLRTLFSTCNGFRKLCYRQKSNGPMCFVEFEDVAYASRAMSELYGNNLGGLVKGGIRLSYSKNPLGVRTPTNGMSNTGLQQQLQAFASTPPYSNFRDSFASQRQTNGSILSVDMSVVRASRRDQDILSPSYGFAASPPPLMNRFVSPPPQIGFQYGQQPISAGLTRSSSQGFASTFSPFGSSTPPTMTPQLGPAESEDTLKHSNSNSNLTSTQ